MKFNDPTEHSKQGDILWADNNFNKPEYRGAHYMIYLGKYDSDPNMFLGAMITGAKKYSGNIPLLDEYFEKTDDDGTAWGFPSKSSLILNHLYLKQVRWQPFEKKGQLTAEGLAFVQGQIAKLTPEHYEGNAL